MCKTINQFCQAIKELVEQCWCSFSRGTYSIINLKPSGLENNSSTCYMNAMIQAIASSNILIMELQKLHNSEAVCLNYFLALLNGINDHHNISDNTHLLRSLMQTIGWDKLSQQDAFDLFTCVIKGIHEELMKFDIEAKMPMKFPVIYRYSDNTFPYKIQNNLGLSIVLSGDYLNPPGVDLKDLLRKQFEISNIDDDPNNTCQMFFYQDIPSILLLHIQANEWNNETQTMMKPNYFIKYEEFLTLQVNVAWNLNLEKDTMEDVQYKLKAIVHHMGGVEGGHYVTYRNYNDNWYLANDDKVEKILFNDKICPYIMIYERIDDQMNKK